MTQTTPRPELLAPAGTLQNMRYAFAYGADAVYAGLPRYSLRVRNNDFDFDHLQQGIDEAHQQGKQFYVVVNIAPHNAKLKNFMRDMQRVVAMQPDAFIMSDPGLIMLVRQQFPELPIHLSVQANVVNYASAQFWQQQGISRIILSRELSLEEIQECVSHCPDLQFEVFVHGALCMAYSGRCLLSGYLNKRDPNQGSCTNSCRWPYQAHPAQEGLNGDLIASSQVDSGLAYNAAEPAVLGEGQPTSEVFLLQERSRPDEWMPAYEDEHGTYIMNSKDLRAVHHVPELSRMGVHSLKIEGRTKSHYYVSRAVQCYRRAIDDYAAGKPFDVSLMRDLEMLANRGYTEGFLRRHVFDEYQNYQQGHSQSDSQFVAQAEGQAGTRLYLLVKNRFAVGDQLQLMTPEGNYDFQLQELFLTKTAEPLAVAPGSDWQVFIHLPEDWAQKAMPYGLLVRVGGAG